MVAVALLASVPKLQVIVGVPQVPWLEVADTKVKPAGRVSDKVTPVAVVGPLFVTTTV
jgi:hypothetical protein